MSELADKYKQLEQLFKEIKEKIQECCDLDKEPLKSLTKKEKLIEYFREKQWGVTQGKGFVLLDMVDEILELLEIKE